ncbi:hypothetical protein FJZ31_31085 [Candidatus Poribacteria bacterium]|nr:hypothetical protein [Candidatus Poribacteria bacterium]
MIFHNYLQTVDTTDFMDAHGLERPRASIRSAVSSYQYTVLWLHDFDGNIGKAVEPMVVGQEHIAI